MKYVNTVLEEHRFWLQVLGDHARFIRDSLAPTETEYIAKAVKYVDLFDRLLSFSRQSLTMEQLRDLNTTAFTEAKAIREFKLMILKEHLVGKISIHLPPTFINHMVNEVEEYLRILPYLMKEEIPPVAHPLHHHLIWLIDAAGHSGAINDSLDAVEKKFKNESSHFTKTFEDFYLKAVEMAGYLRTNVASFPALSRFNEQVKLEIVFFRAFLDEIEEMELTDSVLSTFSPLMADHMAREECYYLKKLAESSHLSAPECNPAKPRTE